MRKLSYLRFVAYLMVIGAVFLLPEPRRFIVFENFPFMNEEFDWTEDDSKVDPWMEEYFKRTGGLTHHTAEMIARSAIRERDPAIGIPGAALYAFQRDSQHGVFVVVFAEPVTIDGRVLVCVRVTEDKKAELIFSERDKE